MRHRDLSRIVDADGHYVEDVEAWAGYLPQTLDMVAPRLTVGDDGVERFVVGDLYALPSFGSNLMSAMSIGDGLTPRDRTTGAPEVRGRRIAESAPGGLDPFERLKLMDDEGIALTVLYPTLALALLPSLGDPRVAVALARALNSWVVERYATADPVRLLPVATIPLHDPAGAAGELRRCVEDQGMKAAWVSPAPVMGRCIDDPEHDIVWATAEELGVPVTTHHGSGGGAVPALGRERNRTWLGSHAMGHTFEAMAAVVGLYTSGVFTRFPSLRWGFMEAGCGWLPFWLEQIHEHAERMQVLLPGADLGEIRDVVGSRCIVTGEGDDRFVPSVLAGVGAGTVVWASDYPHFDCSLPGLTADVRERGDLDDLARRRFAVANAVEFFSLDADL
jgi:predicted TIM-barrel fold metal-dependent hydrolase